MTLEEKYKKLLHFTQIVADIDHRGLRDVVMLQATNMRAKQILMELDEETKSENKRDYLLCEHSGVAFNQHGRCLDFL